MTRDESSLFINGIVIGVFVSVIPLCFIGIPVIGSMHTSHWEAAAIKHNAAYYHPQTGKFEWKPIDESEAPDASP